MSPHRFFEGTLREQKRASLPEVLIGADDVACTWRAPIS
jgi:hypothetical protein